MVQDIQCYVQVPVMAPGPAQPPAPGPAMRLGPVPGPARAKAAPGKSAGIYMVAGVAGAAQTLPRPALGGYPSADAWDEIHGGGVGSMEVQPLPCTSHMHSHAVDSQILGACDCHTSESSGGANLDTAKQDCSASAVVSHLVLKLGLPPMAQRACTI